MKRNFNSKNWSFRPTTLSGALMRAGIKGSHGPQMVRESVATVNGRPLGA